MAEPKNLFDAFDSLTFKSDRKPESTDMDQAFYRLAAYRDGAVFLAHWAGHSQWEVHHSGDELVMVVEGSTKLTMLVDGEEVSHELQPGQLIVVPQSTWHRLDTEAEVKLLTVTPQPTEHSIPRPE